MYAYGAAHVLQEILTIKSDDVIGRVKVYEALVKGKTINQAGIPESFRVLIKEFQALGLNIQIVDNEDKIHDLRELELDEEKDDTISIEEIDLKDNNEPSEPEEEFVEEDEEEFSNDLDDLEFPGDDSEIEEGDELC